MTYKKYWEIKNSPPLYVYIKYLTPSGSGQLLIKMTALEELKKKIERLYFKKCEVIKQVYMKIEDNKLFFARSNKYL